MALDRDELAARFAVALTPTMWDADLVQRTPDSPEKVATVAVSLADALLSRLAPAPSPSLADGKWRDANAGKRPEWVRITSINEGHCGSITAGRVYRVTGWGSRDEPFVTNNRGETHWSLSAAGRDPDPTYPTFASWEPCAAPGAAPSPAASPAPYVPTPATAGAAAYVPQVGDVVVGLFGPDDGKLARVDSTDPLSWSFWRDGVWRPGYGFTVTKDARPATAAERAAAGLPVDAPAFDEAKEREAAMEAYRAGTDGCIDPDGTKYPRCRDSFRNGWIARARVAAKGGA